MANPPPIFNINGVDYMEMTGPGFELYVPPTPMVNDRLKPPHKGRFVMLDDVNDVFYDIDYDAALKPAALGNTVSWADLALHTVREPALVLQLSQWQWLSNPQTNFARAFLVSIESRNEGIVYARRIGSVFVRKVQQEYMNWYALRSEKGEELPAEMRAGLLRKLWNRSPSHQSPNISYVTPASVLDKMPRPWHKDGAWLNWELDHQYAGGSVIPPSQCWRLRA